MAGLRANTHSPGYARHSTSGSPSGFLLERPSGWVRKVKAVWKPPTPPVAPASSRGESTPQKPSRTRRGGRSSRRGSGGNGNDGRRTPQPQREHAPRESKQAQQLKVHAPGCSCARLARTRGRHAAEGRASGYVVASRDATT